MERVRSYTLYFYKHRFVRYLFVGGTTFIMDFAILYFLHSVLELNLGASASVAYWIAISYNFVLNRYWTFDSHEKESLKRHITTYFMLLVFNYLFTVAFVSIAGEHINYIIAKAITVILQMVWTYPIYKKFIFIETNKTTPDIKN